MGDIWTVSDWSIGDVDPATFVSAFRRFADAATARGGAHEGMILQDADDPRTSLWYAGGRAQRLWTTGPRSGASMTLS